MWRADSKIRRPKPESKPNIPMVAVSTARPRAVVRRHELRGPSSPSMSWQMLRPPAPDRAASPLRRVAPSQGVVRFPGGATSRSLSSIMGCNSPSSSSLSAPMAVAAALVEDLSAGGLSQQEAMSMDSMRRSRPSTTGFQAITRKSAHKNGSNIDLSSTNILMRQKTPTTQSMTKLIRSRKAWPSVRPIITCIWPDCKAVCNSPLAVPASCPQASDQEPGELAPQAPPKLLSHVDTICAE
mmetsp:Transcript_92911/g.261883  ORF Transcript_92911/g.261883 Transcript_92911/m.261883 type:complete len:240 (+) Transcript_92911:3-722(+)